MSVVSMSTSKKREVADGVEATVYLYGRWCSQFGMHTQRGGGDLAGVGRRGGSTSIEVSTGLHAEESTTGVIFGDSIERHAKQLDLSSGGIWSIYYGAKNPLTYSLPQPLTPYPLSLERTHPPWQPGAP